MSNSALVSYTFTDHHKMNARQNKYYNPSGKVLKITPHHQAGNLTMAQIKTEILKTTRQFSCNYAIDSSGNVGLFVPEEYRSWCTSSPANDYLAITIEVANDQIGGSWHISDKAMNRLVDLIVDICVRNGIPRLNYTGDKSGNLTMHKWFNATACPGTYLESKFPWIAAEVNKRLQYGTGPAAEDKPGEIKVGDVVEFLGGYHYKNAKTATPTGGTRKPGPAEVTALSPGSPHPYHLRNTDGISNVYGWVDAETIQTTADTTPAPAPAPVGDRKTYRLSVTGVTLGDAEALRKALEPVIEERGLGAYYEYTEV